MLGQKCQLFHIHIYLFVNCSCSICEILFDSSMLLEHHKDAYDHWSDADISESEDEDDVYRGDCYYTDCDGGRS